jgi:hypothetical protein
MYFAAMHYTLHCATAYTPEKPCCPQETTSRSKISSPILSLTHGGQVQRPRPASSAGARKTEVMRGRRLEGSHLLRKMRTTRKKLGLFHCSSHQCLCRMICQPSYPPTWTSPANTWHAAADTAYRLASASTMHSRVSQACQ